MRKIRTSSINVNVDLDELKIEETKRHKGHKGEKDKDTK